jgi:hypothetical protein
MSNRTIIAAALTAGLLAAPIAAAEQAASAEAQVQAETQTQAADPAQPAQPAAQNFSDAQVQAFAQASAEIEPLNQKLMTANQAERANAVAQIRSILARHNLDSSTYNTIAQTAQTDTTLAARINMHRTPPANSAG